MQFCSTKLGWQPSEFWKEAPQTVLKQLKIYTDANSEKKQPSHAERLVKRKMMLDRMRSVHDKRNH